MNRFTLADLAPSQTGVIVNVHGADPATSRRLVDLGFAPGSRVEMLRRAPLADPIIFRVAGYDLAIRRIQARCVEVTPDA